MEREETQKRIAQIQRLSKEERIQKNLSLLDNEALFDVELVSSCNIHCSFCPRTDMARNAKRMSEETFDALLSFLPEHAVVMFSGLGESILHPQLENWIQKLRDKNISSCLITNGIRLVPEKQKTLSQAGLAQFQISLHGESEEVIGKIIPKGLKKDKLYQNLSHLSSLMKEPQQDFRVRINFVETLGNAHEREKVQQWTKKWGFEWFYRREHSRGGHLITSNPLIGANGCGIFAAVTFISADGEIYPCVNDVSGQHRFAHVSQVRWSDLIAWKRETINKDVWFSSCATCTDDYRWILISQGQLDENN